MRFFIVNTDYPAFIEWLYANNPGLHLLSFEEQHRARMASLFGTADFYSTNLRKLGYEAWDVIPNIEPMQKQWAREHEVRYEGTEWRLRYRRGIVPWPYRTKKDWFYQILAAQVKAYRPDVLYSMAIETIGSDFLRSVKGYYHLAIGQHAAPLPAHDIGEYDLMLSSLPNQVEYFRQQGMKSEFFRLGFEPSVLDHLSSGGKPVDVVFVGGLGVHHEQGREVLEVLCQRREVQVWGYGIEQVPEISPVRTAYRGAISGTQMYQVLHDAKIVFNRHIDIAEDYANNMRLYEATGVGTMLLTDYKQNLTDLFEPGREVVAYHDANECVELAEYYLARDDEREAIARAGQQRTLREHTYFHRMQELIDIVHRYL